MKDCMRELDDVSAGNDVDTVVLRVMAEGTPGIDEDIQQAHVRMSIEEALGVDSLKKAIKNAVDKR